MMSRSVLLLCLLILQFSVLIKGYSNVGYGQCEDMRQGFFNHYYCTLQCFSETLHLSYIKGDLCEGTVEFATNQNTPVPLPVVGKVIECITIRCKSAVPPSVCGGDYGHINKNDAAQNSPENSKYYPEIQIAKVINKNQQNSVDLGSEDNHDTKENKGDKKLDEAENKSIKDTATAEGIAYDDNINEKLDYDTMEKYADEYDSPDFYYGEDFFDYEDGISDIEYIEEEITEEKTSGNSAVDSEKESDEDPAITGKIKDNKKSDKDSAIAEDPKGNAKSDKDLEIVGDTKNNKKIDKDTAVTGDTKNNKQIDKDPIITEDAKNNKNFDKDLATMGGTKDNKKFDKDSAVTLDTEDNKTSDNASAVAEDTKENKKIDKNSTTTLDTKDTKKSGKDLEIIGDAKDNKKSDKDSEITVDAKYNKKIDKDSAIPGETNDNKKSNKDSTIAGDGKDNKKSGNVDDDNHFKKVDSVKEIKENNNLKAAGETEIISNKNSKTDSATDVNDPSTKKNIKQEDNEKSMIKESISKKSNEHSTKSETISLNPKNEKNSSPNKSKKDSSEETTEHSLPIETSSQHSLSSENSEGLSPTESTEDSSKIGSSKKEISAVSDSAINTNDKSKSSETLKVEVVSLSGDASSINNRYEGEGEYYNYYLSGDDYDTPLSPFNKNEDNSGSNKNENVNYQSNTKNIYPNDGTNSDKTIKDQPIINLNHQTTSNTERNIFPFNINDKYDQSSSRSIAFANSEASPGAKITKNNLSVANGGNKNNYQPYNDMGPLTGNYPVLNNAGNLKNQKNNAQNPFQSPYPSKQQYLLGQNPQNYNIPQNTYALSQANSQAAIQNQQHIYNHPLNFPYQNQFIPYPYGNAGYNLKYQPGNQYWGSFGAPNQRNNWNIPHQNSIFSQKAPNLVWNPNPISNNQQIFPPNNVQFPNYGFPNVPIQPSVANMGAPPPQVYRQIPSQTYNQHQQPFNPYSGMENGH